MARGKLVLNQKTIRKILNEVDGGKRAAAERIAARIPGARVEIYKTDREVAGVVVPFADEALDGAATRAANDTGLRRGRP